jgi:hypothetical protein
VLSKLRDGVHRRIVPAEMEIIVEAKRQLATVMAFWQKVGAPMMESTNVRFRHAPALLVRTLTTAASLRHAIRTYGGFSREEGAGALVAVPIVALAIVFFRRKRQLRRKRQSKALPRPVCRGCLDRVELLRQRRLKYTMRRFSSRSLLEQFLFA